MASNPQQGSSNKQNDQKVYKNPTKKFNKPNVPPNANNGKKPQPPPVKRNTNNGSDKILKDVLSNLECIICLEFLQAPIFMCETGHNICGTCRGKLCLPICQMCKASITNQRNFTLEDICQKMGEPCPNNSYGCTFVSASDNIKAHFEACEYRQYFCPLGQVNGSCLWTGSYNQIVSHFSEMHKSNFMLKFGNQIMFPDFDVYKPDSDVQLLCFGKTLFIYHVKIDIRKNVALWAIQYIGSEKEAQNWKYEFNFYNSKNKKKVTNISEECISHATDIEQVYQSGNCIAIPLFVLKNYLHESKKFTFKFFIRSMAPRLADNMAALKVE